MKKIREGKTKTLYEAEGGNILLFFKDDVTGTGDVVDPGANAVIGQVMGKGNASLKLSKYFFEKLEKAGIPTHYVEADVENNTMLVKCAQGFGEGLEFICRIKATGSFLRRYGKYAKEGQPLNYLVEITLKDDDRGDPLINEDAAVGLGLMSRREVGRAKVLTEQVTRLIEQECSAKGLELIDIKIEFGLVEGEIVVIDEVSGDNMRIRKDGRSVMQKEFCEIMCG